MNNIWFTSDTHFCHEKEFLWKPRGFNSVEEMNEALVENWNKVVKPEEPVYHLGDLALTDMEKALPYLMRLNGTIYWIRGNHDTRKKIDYFMDECPSIWDIGYADVLKIGKHSFFLSHYPTLTCNFDEKKFSQHVINLHGHTHQQTNWLHADNPFMYHVGVDSHNCTPVHIDEVITDIKNRWFQQEKLYEKYKEDNYDEVK
jgi:calcineurin-like phosphoesterase family protein